MKRSYLFGAVLGAVLVLAGCGGGSESAGSYVVAETTAAQPEVMESVALDTAGVIEGETGELAPAEEVTSPSSARKLIRTVSLDMETDDFDSVLAEVNNLIRDMGGYMEQSDLWGEPRSASMTARIPSSRLDSFLGELEGRGNITRRSETTEDVTLQYTDLESRKKTLEVEQDRIWALLEKADSLDAVIALEQRLSEIRYSLESMESQLRLYDNQVEYSTVNLNLSEVKDFTLSDSAGPSERMKDGFKGNLQAVKNGITDFFVGLIATLPLWILPAVIIGLSLWFVMRRRKGRFMEIEEKEDAEEKNK